MLIDIKSLLPCWSHAIVNNETLPISVEKNNTVVGNLSSFDV